MLVVVLFPAQTTLLVLLVQTGANITLQDTGVVLGLPYTNGAQEGLADISFVFSVEQFTVSRYLVSFPLTSIYQACPGLSSKLVYFTVVTHPKTHVQRVGLAQTTNNWLLTYSNDAGNKS